MIAKYLKRWIPVALCAAILCAANPMAVTAASKKEVGAMPISAVTSVGQENAASAVFVSGALTKLDGNRLELKGSDSSSAYSDIVLNVTDDTLILDAKTLMPVFFDELKDGAKAYAYTSPVMTRSLPPQSNAMVVLYNIPADYKIPSYDELLERVNPPQHVMTSGMMQKAGENSLLIENSGTGLQKLIVHVSEDTKIIDAVKGTPVKADKLRENESLIVYTGMAMAMSNPPQAAAQLILCNIPADYKVPAYHQIAKVIETQDKKNLILTTSGGETLTVTQKTKLNAYVSGSASAKKELVPGANVLVWTDWTSKDTVSKLLVVPSEYRGYLEIGTDRSLTADGKKLELGTGEIYRNENGAVMLPLTSLCKAYGLTATRSNANGTVKVTKSGTKVFEAKIGVVQSDDDLWLSEKIEEKNGQLYLSQNDAARLLNLLIVK